MFLLDEFPTKKMPTGAELFIASLKKLGTSHIFTLVGDHLNEILRVADREGLSIVDTRHESAAVHMADGWGRITRTPGVSMVTGAPGHTNSITGIATAYYTGSPLLAVSGMSSSKLRDRFAFQDMDQLALVQGITKYAAVPADAGQIPFYVYRAFLESMTGRSGPTHLSVPVDLLTAQVETHAPLPRGPVQVRRPGPEPTDLERAIEVLESAERPAVIAGSGAWWADAGAALEAFLEKTSLPLFTIGLARGLVSDEHPLCFGYADPTLNRAAEQSLQQADVVLVIGKKLDYRLRLGGPQLFSPEAKLIQVDVHAAELGMNRRLEVGMVADAKLALEDFVEALEGRPQPDRSAWLAQIRSARESSRNELEAIARQPSQPMHPLHLFREMLPWLPHDATLCWDGGDFVHWGRNYIPARKPMHWLRLGGLAGLGVCFPIGLVAQIARPNERAIVVTGDGSLGFYLSEMDTAVRFNLPVIIIVGNDGGWGIERELQRGSFDSDKTVACELRRTRYDLVMKAFGGDGEFVERPDQIRPALDRALRSDKPFLINVDIKGYASPFTAYQLRRVKR
jgi:acetolactate synthase-1/2/3 large subunit